MLRERWGKDLEIKKCRIPQWTKTTIIGSKFEFSKVTKPECLRRMDFVKDKHILYDNSEWMRLNLRNVSRFAVKILLKGFKEFKYSH